MSIGILIADDHGVLRAGLRALLNAEHDLQVLGEAADGQEALAVATELRPDIVLLDLSMPGMNGIEVTRQLKAALPATLVLILTVHEDESLLQEAIRVGASGYIIKRAVESELINAIRAVSRGEMYVHPAMTRALMKDLAPRVVSNTDPLKILTRREIEVLRYIAQGHTNRQIADALCLSVRTVESHRANLMSKLNLS
ncbi:MAG TPA: response regulator transcription factor, partial [Anaerolineae bacterium]